MDVHPCPVPLLGCADAARGDMSSQRRIIAFLRPARPARSRVNALEFVEIRLEVHGNARCAHLGDHLEEEYDGEEEVEDFEVRLREKDIRV